MGLANTPSSQKRMRQERRRRVHNRAQRSRIKSAVKRVMSATDTATGTLALEEAYQLLDRMATRRLIHRNKAARKKSQLARHVAGIAG
jgi:small subunit ribosomal protein S20